MKNPGEQFLQSYDVHKKPQAIKATERKESQTGESLVNDSDERITAYVERLERVFLNPNEQTRDRNISMMKPHIHNSFVIKEEDFPDSYFDYQKKLMKEERGLGDVEFTPEQKQEEIEKAQEAQKESLDSWIDYLSKDNPYPPAIKLFVIQGILKLGKFDTNKYKFGKRVDSTVAPFPEIDREALARVMGALQDAHYNEEEVNNSSEKLKEMVANNTSFGKMYAEAIQELDKSSEGEKNWEETEGEWRTFKRGSEPSIMQDTLANKRSNLCIGNGMTHAISYLNNGDMHIYYSKDNRGNYTTPRIAISVQNDSVWEVRGTYNKNEDIDPYINDILNEKLADLPQGEKYQKKSTDMKKLTEIDNMVKSGQELGKEDLRFLYEIDNTIEGFGYQRDPRIAEILQSRNPKEDAPIVFDCQPSEIAWDVNEVNENTKAYIGQWSVDIFQVVRNYPNITHLYESFPDKKIFMQSLETDPSINSPKKAQKALEDKNIYIYDWGKDILAKTEFSQTVEKYELVRFTVGQLGFPKGATTDEIYKRAQELALEQCPAEVGPHLRLKYTGREWFLIAMKQIADRSGDPYAFDLGHNGDQSCLNSSYAKPGLEWRSDSEFVFRYRKLKT